MARFGLRRSERRPAGPVRSGRRPLGVVGEALAGEADLLERLGGLGEAGLAARSLDVAVEETLPGLVSLSTLSAPLAVAYLERVKHAIKQLQLQAGVLVTTRAYLAHMIVEGDPTAYGASEVPVLGTLPPLRKGRPPQDLLNRVVKASRRGFEHICALDTAVWEGFVACITWRVHSGTGGLDAGGGDGGGDGGAYLDPAVIDGLARFGWVLRQVDLHYRLEPERA
jgi:hypothetical protein